MALLQGEGGHQEVVASFQGVEVVTFQGVACGEPVVVQWSWLDMLQLFWKKIHSDQLGQMHHYMILLRNMQMISLWGLKEMIKINNYKFACSKMTQNLWWINFYSQSPLMSSGNLFCGDNIL